MDNQALTQLLDSLSDVYKYSFLLKVLTDFECTSSLSEAEKNCWFGLLGDCSDLLDQHIGDMIRFAKMVR